MNEVLLKGEEKLENLRGKAQSHRYWAIYEEMPSDWHRESLMVMNEMVTSLNDLSGKYATRRILNERTRIENIELERTKRENQLKEMRKHRVFVNRPRGTRKVVSRGVVGRGRESDITSKYWRRT